ncbi:TonB-dependent vitamin B12 receptor [Thiothrix winogradskyi]|uniref:TonB-dependent vitamin B12 receptor n=1 Tax=Thiothrix winogradskyi TaxID=96472 RepID=A0ABY3T157_9GAMM|nr:TonB-dependent vitamin B12 receptor [Thiothrix winogradskyi]UJS24488.1 TonB-dependent vitamin B12 receptor [Thiothrix winogradskyi]
MKLSPLAAQCGTVTLCLLASPLVLAEEATTLDEIVVTADRKARTIDETLAPVSIITRADIEKYQASSIPDVLRRLPGISLSNSGGVGKATSVFIRGTNSSHVLVLVDGIKMGSATTGTVAFEDLPLDQVDRIEVVRGPRSSLYGSEAIGGVIQIFTRKGGNAGKGFQPEISVSAGSRNTQKANVNLAGGNATTWYNLNAGTEQTDGFNATANNREPDADGYERESVSLRAGHRFANGTDADVSLLQAQGSNEYDGSFGNQSEFVQQAVSGKLRHTLGDKAVLTAQLGQSKDESDNFKDGDFKSRFNTTRTTATVQADVQVTSNSSLTVGIDQQNDKVDSDTTYDVTSRNNTGVFSSYQHSIGATQFDVSARHDDNEQFGKHTTGGVAVGHDLNNGMRVTAAYGTAFKAPTFNNLYYPFSGDTSLQPEESQNLELGVSGKAASDKVRWSANAFSNTIDNLISYPPPTYAVSQTDKARIQGVELSAGTQVAGWEVNANLTLQKPENRSGADAGKNLIYRPEQLASVDIDRDLGKFRVGATLRGESQRYTDTANTDSKKLAGYGTLDLRADYQVAKDWTVGAKLSNVLDKDYQTNNGYNQDGMNGLVTVKYAPK